MGLLLGYFSIGEAEDYRDYFKTIPAAALGPENPQWAGNYQVAYWTPEWRDVATAYTHEVLAAGFDGIYLDVVDEYQQQWAKTNAPGGAAGAEQAMADLVKFLADYARAKNPEFQFWANNAEELLANQTYFSIIDGMFKENLYYTDSGSKQAVDEVQWSLGLLQPMLAADKDVIAIEYVSTAARIADVHFQAARDGVGSYTADINLDGVNYSGVLPGQTINDDWGGTTTPPAPVSPPITADPTLIGDDKSNMLAGQAGNDKLIGKGSSDILDGGPGNDWIDGGNGKDQLTGGLGADTFVFRVTGSKHLDTIRDFAPNEDAIALERAIFTKVGPLGDLADSAYWEGARAHDASDRVIYDTVSGTVYYDPDGTGRMEQIELFRVSLGTDLSHTDFFII